ncbi:hypothetical protein, partial [Streptomyces cucumeris]|uniref:hypothetical protein n=1 Tax=Streptomyces cucumeris TaxID=2962890 RepID=UPI003D7185A8
MTMLYCGDGLADEMAAHQVADATGLTVMHPLYGANTEGGQIHLLEGPNGEPGRWVIAHPGGRSEVYDPGPDLSTDTSTPYPDPQDSLGKVAVSATPEVARTIEARWGRAVGEQGGESTRLTVTVDGDSVNAHDLVPLLLTQIGAADQAGALTIQAKPKDKLKAGANHKLLLSFNGEDGRGTISLEVRVEKRQQSAASSSSRPQPEPSSSSRPPTESARSAPDPQATARNNQAKLAVGRTFSTLMRDIGLSVVLGGGAQINLLFDSPRPIADLDFRMPQTMYVRDFADRINQAIAERFPDSGPNALVKDEKDGRALTGVVNGVEITVGPSSLSYGDARDVGGITAPTPVDSLFDKAQSLAERTGEKQHKDLFDLLWALGETPGSDVRLAVELEERRGEAYLKRAAKQSRLAPTLKAQFANSLGELTKSKKVREALETEWRDFGATQQDIERLRGTLADLTDAFRVGSGPFRALVLTAGNFTGDVFGL